MEGSFALGIGETDKAKQKYKEAAEALEQEIAANPPAKVLHTLRFLAATQYYLGGYYTKACKLTQRIEGRFLDNEIQLLLAKFRRDVDNRSSSGYLPKMHKKVFSLYNSQQHQQLMNLLQLHPYLYNQMDLAFFRAVLCEHLGFWKAAAIFHRDGALGLQDGSDYMLVAAGPAMRLCMEGRIDAAWEFIEHLRNLMPNTVTNMVASLMYFHRARIEHNADVRSNLRRGVIQYFDQGWEASQKIPETNLSSQMQNIISLCLDAAVLTAWQLDDISRAQQLADEAVMFKPENPDALALRGMLNYPSDASINDFRMAILLPDCGYLPFVYLACHAYNTRLIRDGERLCREALARNPSRLTRANLFGLLAVFRDLAGGSHDEVEAIFKEALSLDPTNQQVIRNYEKFKSPAGFDDFDEWKKPFADELFEPDLLRWELPYTQITSSRNRIEQLLTAGSL